MVSWSFNGFASPQPILWNLCYKKKLTWVLSLFTELFLHWFYIWTTPGCLLSANYVFFIVHPNVWDIGYSVLFRFPFAAYNLLLFYFLLKIISYNTTIVILLFCGHLLPITKLRFHVNQRLIPGWESFFHNLILFCCSRWHHWIRQRCLVW